MPPAYPAPSPAGYIPRISLWPSSFLKILIGDDVLVSIADKTVLPSAKPFIFLSNSVNASFNAIVTNSGSISCKLAKL